MWVGGAHHLHMSSALHGELGDKHVYGVVSAALRQEGMLPQIE